MSVGHGYPVCDAPVEPSGCGGRQLPGSTRCLSHADAVVKTAYFGGLTPGADIDHSGTDISGADLAALREALTSPATGRPTVGKAAFPRVKFAEAANFTNVDFTGVASFGEAVFDRACDFTGAVFSKAAHFGNAEFKESHPHKEAATFRGTRFMALAEFRTARFAAKAEFDQAVFESSALFQDAHFEATGRFSRCDFAGITEFHRTEFKEAVFAAAEFRAARELGPFVSTDTANLTEAKFHAPISIKAAAHHVNGARAVWYSSASLLLRYATVDLQEANLAAPFAVGYAPGPWGGTTSAEARLIAAHAGATEVPKVTSLRGVDCAHVVLTDTDLASCQLIGAFHLDQVQLRGRTKFAEPPKGLRWTRRRTLAEEHYWRRLNWPAWQPTVPPHAVQDPPGPEDVAALYRQLRKSLEDGKDEPGAADFYYGEMGDAPPRHGTHSAVGSSAAAVVLGGLRLRAAPLPRRRHSRRQSFRDHARAALVGCAERPAQTRDRWHGSGCRTTDASDHGHTRS